MYKVLNIKNMIWVLSILQCTETLAATTPEKSNSVKAVSVFATVGKETITWRDFETEFKNTAKNKFFHGQPANKDIAILQRTVADKLTTDALLLNEANRRKLKPDSDAVNQEIQKFERKLTNDAQWQQSRDRVMPAITKRFQNENLVKKLEEAVRKVAPPTDEKIQAYYTSHPDKFTPPLEQRVSLILLGVDPSSTTEEWNQTVEDGKALIKSIREGADFAEMATKYSKDAETVDQGGDMGYLHDGMLPGLPQESVNKLKVGEVSEPIRLLEGVAIFRLTDRRSPGLSSFESSKQRASELLAAEQSDDAWKLLIAELKKKTSMHIDESRFLPLADANSTESNGVVLPASPSK
jgi:peptidyl-prolyl cis-trans isomerase C